MAAIQLAPTDPVPDGFEPIHTTHHYYDGPREGLTEFQGLHHVYSCPWDESADDYSREFWLQPADDQQVRLILESWAIWLRWLAASSRGEATIETHPALPEDRARHNELQPFLKHIFQIDEARALRAVPTFAVRGPLLDREWFVRWTPVTGQGEEGHSLQGP